MPIDVCIWELLLCSVVEDDVLSLGVLYVSSHVIALCEFAYYVVG